MGQFVKSDYEKVAGVLRECLREEKFTAQQWAVVRVCTSMVGMFSEDNERFDVRKFYHACGIRRDGIPMLVRPSQL